MMDAPTAEQIEAAAAAIRDVVANRSGNGRDWRSLPDRIKSEYRAEAEAALRAVRCFEM